MKNKRLHYIDALRASMMLLGPVFHAGLSFTYSPIDEFWPHKFETTSLVFDFVSSLIHAFRIPVFFMIAGYFMAFQMKSLSIQTVLLKRWKRIMVPLLVGLLTLVPLVEFSFHFANSGNPPSLNVGEAVEAFLQKGFLTSYLWFLYYLGILYLVHTGVQVVTKRYPSLRMAKQSWAVGGLFLWFVFILISGKDTIHGEYSFFPSISSLVYFGFFYFLGTVEWKKGWETFLADQGTRLVLLGFVLFVLLTGIRYLLLQAEFSDNRWVAFSEVLLIPPSTIALSFGLIGLHIKYIDQHVDLVRYLSGSSYFIYLVHLPILVILQTLLSTFIPFIGILSIVTLAITLLISYSLYEVYRRLFPNGVLAH